MKKIIILMGILLLCVFYSGGIDASAAIYVTVDNDVRADITYEAVPNDTSDKTVVLLTLAGDKSAVFDDDIIGDNVNHWFNRPLDADLDLMPVPFNDIPDGLDAFVLDIEDNRATVEIKGTVAATANKGISQICLAIPGDVIIVDGDVYGNTDDYVYTNLLLSLAQYKIYEPVVEYKVPYTISGTVEEALSPQIVVVTINDDCLLKANSAVSLNQRLPIVNGLTPVISDVSDKEISITYTGIPIETSQDLIHTIIIKDYLLPDTKDKIVADRIDVKFDIIDKPPPALIDDTPDTYVPPITGVR